MGLGQLFIMPAAYSISIMKKTEAEHVSIARDVRQEQGQDPDCSRLVLSALPGLVSSVKCLPCC